MKADKQHKVLQAGLIQPKQERSKFSFVDNRLNAIIQAKMINVIQRQINQGVYNNARQILIDAGSITAQNAHPIHNQPGGVPNHYGQQLVDEAQEDEANFRAQGDQAAADQIRVAVRIVKNMFGFYP
ncbi:hypothetical protein K6V26_20925 [Parabacteroides goldsteinii]|jgi:hypothetical protein|uniref:hypothetical protein n=1 Tax=Parabacteroides goldsteinii TaxID=328812 RepID=UPI001CCB1B3C|nr:hypothetical protein [Parabacteroides goldsteinii]UBD73584.1 hypothetical protein K6V26_20925 [Parabacteroides goldsteinii]DAV61739.1 MAG TPA: Pre-phenomycin, ANTITUMOR PROTEIN [Caudoviricetes sp.]